LAVAVGAGSIIEYGTQAAGYVLGRDEGGLAVLETGQEVRREPLEWFAEIGLPAATHYQKCEAGDR
jgi:hypothetical protein